MTTHANNNIHKRPVDMVVYFLTFASAVITIAAASHALVSRNYDVGEASNTAALGGIYLIISTAPLTQPGYALSVAAGGLVINALTLLIFSISPIPKFFRKNFWIILVGSIFGSIFMIATAIAVMYEAKTGSLSLYATVKATGAVVPTSVLQAQAGAIGLTLDFWGKDYVKFMAISGLITAVLSLVNAFCAVRFGRRVKAAHVNEHNRPDEENRLDTVLSHDEKASNQHLDHRL